MDTTPGIRPSHRFFRAIMALMAFLLAVLPAHTARAQANAVLSPASETVNTPLSTTLIVTSADTIPPNTLFKVWVPAGFKEFIWLVINNVLATTQGASSAEVVSILSASYERPPIWDDDILPYVITVRLKNAPLLPGEQLRLKMGDELNKIRTPTTAGVTYFKVATIAPGSETWNEVARAPFTSVGSVPVSYRAYLPAVVQPGDTALLRVVFLDFHHNRSPYFEGSIGLTCTDAVADMPSRLEFSLSDKGYREIPVVFRSEGFHRIDLRIATMSPDGASLSVNSRARTNYARVVQDPSYYIYWGDLHSHSGWSRDGAGTGSFDYAETTACLDFFATAEHTNPNAGGNDVYGINSEEWQTIKDEIVSRHKPGRFVPVTAWENSYYAEQGGHHIAYFDHADSLIDLVPRMIMQDYRTIFALWQGLSLLPPEVRVLCWPHFTGEFFYNDQTGPGWDFSDLSINQGDIPRLIGPEYIHPMRTSFEIYSQHGQSEVIDPNHPLTRQGNFWGVQDALAMGEKLGFVAFTDSHLATPGVSGDGLGAIMAPALTRTDLFDAIIARRTYGSTGERIYIDFTINDTLMGGDVALRGYEVPHAVFTVYGTGELDRVELLKWDFNFGTYGDDFHPDFQTIATFPAGNADHLTGEFDDVNFYGDAVYYLRAIQKDPVNGIPVWAWSSPIWVDNIDLDTTIVTGMGTPLSVPVRVYPNPVQSPGRLMAAVSVGQPVQGVWQLYDVRGAVLATESCNLQVGSNTVPVNLPPLAEGLYWLHLSDGSGRPMGRVAVVIR